MEMIELLQKNIEATKLHLSDLETSCRQLYIVICVLACVLFTILTSWILFTQKLQDDYRAQNEMIQEAVANGWPYQGWRVRVVDRVSQEK